jgi:hypothetical protein
MLLISLMNCSESGREETWRLDSAVKVPRTATRQRCLPTGTMSVGSRRSERRNRISWNYRMADPRITEIKIVRFDLPQTSNLRIAT